MSKWIGETQSSRREREKERVQRDTPRVTWLLTFQFLVLGPASEAALLILELCKIPLCLWGTFHSFWPSGTLNLLLLFGEVPHIMNLGGRQGHLPLSMPKVPNTHIPSLSCS